MRVLYLFDALNPGGLEKSMLEIIKRLEYMAPVVCHIYPHNALYTDFVQEKLYPVSLNITKRFNFIKAWRRLITLMEKEKPDLIHLAGLFALLIGRAAGKYFRIPVVDGFTNEPYTPQHYASIPPQSRWKLRIIQESDRLTKRWVTHFISNSYAIQASYQKTIGVSPHNVSVIYRGRDPEPYIDKNHAKIDKLRQEFKIDKTVPVILNIARLIPRKGHDELIQSLGVIKQQFNKILLLIAGDGHYCDQLKALAEGIRMEKNVVFLGHRNDIPDLLHLADIFVFPSHYEGLPGALIEAMMAGCPIVASDIPVHREIIFPPKNGLLAPVGNYYALAEAMKMLLMNKDYARKLGRCAQLDAFNQFHIDNTVKQYEGIYQNLIQKKRQRIHAPII